MKDDLWSFMCLNFDVKTWRFLLFFTAGPFVIFSHFIALLLLPLFLLLSLEMRNWFNLLHENEKTLFTMWWDFCKMKGKHVAINFSSVPLINLFSMRICKLSERVFQIFHWNISIFHALLEQLITESFSD
jgi:hypothetical protein